jgi:DNA cross-link repair 1A protein
MTAKTMTRKATPKGKTALPPSKQTQTTLVAKEWAGKAAANNARNKSKPQGPANGNIMAFFKRAEDINNRIFLQERGSNPTIELDGGEDDLGWSDEVNNGVMTSTEPDEARYNENGGSNKKRKLSEDLAAPACSPSPPEAVNAPAAEALPSKAPGLLKPRTKSGPFVDDSDDDDEEEEAESLIPRRGMIKLESREDLPNSKPMEDPSPTDEDSATRPHAPPRLKTEETSQFGRDEFDEADLEDDELLEGEEYDERRWMKEQRKLEMEAAGFEGDPDDFDTPALFPESIDDFTNNATNDDDVPICPLCSSSLKGLSDQESSVHVNACLDGKPMPLPSSVEAERESTPTPVLNAKAFKRAPRPPKEAQANPFQLGAKPSAAPTSAFSKLMAGHAEDAAWATAAAANNAARGKPAFERTCQRAERVLSQPFPQRSLYRSDVVMVAWADLL